MDISKAIQELRKRNESNLELCRLPIEEECTSIESSLGVEFHPDYRGFLLEASDVTFGAIEPADITNPSSHTYLPEVVNSAKEYGLPDGLLPICEDDADYYCMDNEGRVVFWSSDGVTDEAWSSLAEWIMRVWIEENE